MNEFLKPSLIRQITILKTLYNANDWLTSSQLATITDYPVRTVQHLIPYLNQYFSPFHIQHHSSYGYKLEIPQHLGFEFVYEQIYATTHEFLVLEAVFFNNRITTEELSDLLFISPATVNRSINRINQVFQQKKLDIKITSSDHQLIGNELTLRNTIFQFLREKYSIQTLPFPAEAIKTYQQLLYDGLIATNSKTTYAYYDFDFLTFIFCVVIIRIQAGFTLKIKNDSFKKNPVFYWFTANEAYAQLFKQQTKLTWGPELVEQLLAPFMSEQYFHNYRQLADLAQLEPTVAQLVKQLDHFLQQLADELGVPCDFIEKISVELINNYPLFIGHNQILFNQRHEFINGLKVDFPDLIKKLISSLSNFSFGNEFKWTNYALYDAAYLIITNWPNLIDHLSQIKEPLTILLVCTFEVGHAEIIKKMITTRRDLNVICTTSSSLTIDHFNAEAQAFDIIITNSNKLTFNHKNIVHFAPIPSPRDWQTLLETITKIQTTDTLPGDNF